MNVFIYSSPIGSLEIKANKDFVYSIKFLDKDSESVLTNNYEEIFIQCKEQLDEYFAGLRKIFDFRIEQEGTDFQKRVWTQLTTIPYGKTISYSSLAIQLGDLKKIRAVGTTNGRNNLAIVIPCHRVIGSKNELTGYAGGLWRKQWLLEHEAKYTSGVHQLRLI